MLISLAALAPLAQATEPEVTPTWEIRPRAELVGPTSDPVTQVTQRTRVGLDGHLEAASFRIVVQDVRTWGMETHTLKDFDADAIDVHEAWLGWRPDDDTLLRLGRFELNIHEQRLVGAVGWTQQARSFDGAHLALRRGRLDGEAAVAWVGSRAGGQPADAWFAVLRAGPVLEGGTADLLVVGDGAGEAEDGTPAWWRVTPGAYLAATRGSLHGRLEGYAQVGGQGEASTLAWMVSALGSYQLSGGASVALAWDLLSGDPDPSDTTNGAFAAPWATNHKWYGFTDVMGAFSEGGWADGRGLHDGQLQLHAPVGPATLHLAGHVFLAAAPQDGDTLLGEEVDLWTTAKLKGPLGMHAGIAGLARPGQDPYLYGWFMLDLKG